MTKSMWTNELQQLLGALPTDRVQDAIMYYEELVQDRREHGEKEEEIIASFGNVQDAAKQILAEFPTESTDLKQYSNMLEWKTTQTLTDIVILRQFSRVHILRGESEELLIQYPDYAWRKYGVKVTQNCVTFETKRQNVVQWIAGFFSFASLRYHLPIYVFLPKSFTGNLTVKCCNASAMLLTKLGNLASVHAVNFNGRCVASQMQVAQELDMVTSNGKIFCDHILAQQARFVTSNGTLYLQQIEAEQIKAKTSNAKILASDCVAEQMDMQSSNGKLTLDRMQSPHIHAKTSNARIAMTMIGQSENYTFDCKTSNGYISLDGVKLFSQVLNRGKELTVATKTSNANIEIQTVKV